MAGKVTAGLVESNGCLPCQRPLHNGVQPGLEPTTCKSQVRRPTSSATASPVEYSVLRWCLCRPGYIDVYVGGQQPNQATAVESNILHGVIHIAPSTPDFIRQPDRHSRMRVEKWNSLDHNAPVIL